MKKFEPPKMTINWKLTENLVIEKHKIFLTLVIDAIWISIQRATDADAQLKQ